MTTSFAAFCTLPAVNFFKSLLNLKVLKHKRANVKQIEIASFVFFGKIQPTATANLSVQYHN